MARDPWDDLIDFANESVAGSEALADDPTLIDPSTVTTPQGDPSLEGVIDFAPQGQAPVEEQPRQPTGKRPWKSLYGQPNDLDTVEGRGMATLQGLGSLANPSVEGAASRVAGLVPESYEFDPQGFVTIYYPGGKTSKWSVIDDALPPQILGAYEAEYGGLPIDPETGDPSIPLTQNSTEDYLMLGQRPPADFRDNSRNLLPDGVDAFARGAVPFELDDELDALFGTIAGGDFGDELIRSRGIRDYDQENSPYLRGTGDFVGSLALPTKLGSVGGLAAKETAARVYSTALAQGLSRPAARTLAKAEANAAFRSAIARQSGKEGAIYGGAEGASAGDSFAERGIGGITGSAIGAPAGYGLGAAAGQAGRLLPTRGTPERVLERRRFDSAVGRMDERGLPVDVLAADRPGAYSSQMASAVTNATLGAIPLSEGADRAVTSLANARTGIAERIGNVRSDDAGIGQVIQRGIREAESGTQAKVAPLYQRIPIQGDAPAQLNNVNGYLAEANRGFSSNPALSRIWSDDPMLQATAEALADGAKNGGLSWDDLKGFRSVIGEKIGQPGLAKDGTDIRRLRGLYGALSEDMRATAAAQGPGALRAFERANNYARARERRVERVFSELLGPDYQTNPERAYRTLMNWGRAKGGDVAKFSQGFRSLPEEAQNSVRASVLEMLGRAPKGRQNTEGNAFSPADFMTQWNDLSPRAKALLFNGEHRVAVDDIARIAGGMKASGKFSNTSRTGLAVGGVGTAGTFVSNPVLGVLSIGAQLGAGKLLGNPKFARWLMALDKKPNIQAINAHVKRLGKLANTAPGMEQDYLNLADQIEQVLDMETAPKRGKE